jgi:hypothetical protein
MGRYGRLQLGWIRSSAAQQVRQNQSFRLFECSAISLGSLARQLEHSTVDITTPCTRFSQVGVMKGFMGES